MPAETLLAWLFLAGGQAKAAAGCPLVGVEYVESFDIGHGGLVRTRRIAQTASGYDVTVEERIPFPRNPEDPDTRPSRKSLKKSREDVERFLERLVSGLDIRELRPSKPKLIGLHPTFATLGFQDACGVKGEVELVFEGYAPEDPAIRPVVEAVRGFFEAPWS